ncbi:TVP38/TMEM64 family protein [Halorhodospira sp. 9622]|uniref:TVP38/TMEM64 family protein n=2 Tax=Ectothiorhodospiraceae TaxID=72276 RepID=UPI001EE7F752|nr:VTT domain-containing protein [Halorhodospira sp. 9622]MCG5538274.1 VTT domain-containing protein [Halorhodospira sp. 9622]
MARRVDPGDTRSMASDPWRTGLALLGLLLGLAILGGWTWQVGAAVGWQPSGLAEQLAAQPLQSALLLMAMMTAVVVLPLPTIPITVASGLLFGPLLGAAIAVAGALAGAAVAFGLARWLGEGLRATRLGRPIPYPLCRDCGDRAMFLAVLVSRLIPVVSFALLSYAAGLTAMRLGPFLLATGVGMLPMTLVYTSLGAIVRVDPAWFIAGTVAALGILLLLPRWVERRNPWNIKRYLSR